MKSNLNYLFIGFIITILMSCEDLKFGNNFLEKPNSDNVSIDTVFASKKYADQALNQFYKSLWDFMPTLRGCHPEGLILDAYTDLGYADVVSWRRGDFDASSNCIHFPFFPFHHQIKEITGNPSFGIRKAYIYIENVDKVPDMSDEEKRVRKAEAKVVIASHYVQLIRFYGGMPWLDHSYQADEILQFKRMTLEETVKKTIDLLDEAAVDLPWHTSNEEYGHLTAAAAKALKFRLLLFVASPLFNNDEPYYEGQASNDLLCWFGNRQDSRWKDALNAGRDFLRLNKENGNYYRIENTGNPREDYVNGYFTRGNQEVIMASFRWGSYNDADKPFRMYEEGYGIPRGNYANMFQWKDGTPFDWNNPIHRANPFFDENGKPNRDIRMYENLLVNGDKWQGRVAQVYTGGREGFGKGSKIKKKTRFGYGFRKFVRDKKHEMKGKPYSCPLIRIPEIYLGLAEVMNQQGIALQKDEFGMNAYDYLNLVHERAGLPAVTESEVAQGKALLNYILDERAREFGQEDVRYFDMIRYKKGAEWATRPMEVLETKKINKNKFEYTITVRDDIKYLWSDNWYLLPFPTAEINKKYGLIQNPGW